MDGGEYYGGGDFKLGFRAYSFAMNCLGVATLLVVLALASQVLTSPVGAAVFVIVVVGGLVNRIYPPTKGP